MALRWLKFCMRWGIKTWLVTHFGIDCVSQKLRGIIFEATSRSLTFLYDSGLNRVVTAIYVVSCVLNPFLVLI